MKTLKFFAGLLCAVLLCTSCNENTPDISKGNEQIKGIWRIEKGTRTYYLGAGQTVEQLDIPSRLPIPQEWYFGAFQGNEMVKYNPYSISQDFRWRDYSLTIVDNCYNYLKCVEEYQNSLISTIDNHKQVDTSVGESLKYSFISFNIHSFPSLNFT